MNAEQYKKLVKQTSIGKVLPDAIYFHKDYFNEAPPLLIKFIKVVANALKIEDNDWNLVKLFKNDFRISLLNYPTFFENSYPALHQSVTIDLVKLSHRIAKYDTQDNPPILHRKETMIPTSHKYHEEFSLITQEGEAIGLYENTRMIGFKNSWERLIEKHGYELVDGRLFRSSAVTTNKNEKVIDRHKTALVRHELSAPIKSIAKHGFLSGDYSIFDYGCGRGDDLRELEAHGIDALGWDPNHRPDVDKVQSDIVNIGFVINVIEDKDERIEALLGAWELTNKILVVSAMLANESYISQFTPYKDGVITSRNTFQKYFTQAELKTYIENTLDENAIAISPGIFYIFRDKEQEQIFLQNRHKRTYKWKQLTTPEPTDEVQARILFTQHEELFTEFWNACLFYGRLPATEEFERSNELKEVIGSTKKAFRLVEQWFEPSEMTVAETMRKEDLLVYFALSLFGQRKAYTHLSDTLKRDIKAFFDTYKVAQNQAKEMLFSISDTQLIEDECILANKTLPASLLNDGHSLILHKKFAEMLPPILRIYVGAATQIFGELDDIDLIKIHITSGKVSFMGYDDFDGKPLPLLVERIKVKMAEQDIDYFDYIDEFKRPVFFDKHLLIDDSFNHFKIQKKFHKNLVMKFKILENGSSNCDYSGQLFQLKLPLQLLHSLSYKNYKKLIL
ncbi:DNA phosphorothioation-associated putative methyltransferase [Thalassomonas sp. M1454]|uniref:DNA phosphorothioation-associated putative methyltransferase n=1 Tax=Thalassomonas sp. M1454 TaxID=2594477 RepID=UPI00117DD204|nr:DNA phosphorothioation-associated putative methyltransferase [Thalassomonas sp. M1454]TRX56698.1 DNA phosphorothioation-associated putative methyltransferase [Thalassomonas sp. M1454]